MKYTYKEIVDSLPAKKNSKSSFWVKLWVRKASFPFTWLFINLGFSANQVTVFSIFVSLFACLCYALPYTGFLAVAVFLINFWLILDCVDGNIARCKKQKKTYGEFVDAMGGYFTVAFVYFAISISAYNTGGLLFPKQSVIILILGGISSISDILARLIYNNFNGIRIVGHENESEKSLNDKKGSFNWLRERISKEISISGLFMPLTIVCAIFSLNDLLTLFYLMINVAVLIATAVMYYRKADSFD